MLKSSLSIHYTVSFLCSKINLNCSQKLSYFLLSLGVNFLLAYIELILVMLMNLFFSCQNHLFYSLYCCIIFNISHLNSSSSFLCSKINLSCSQKLSYFLLSLGVNFLLAYIELILVMLMNLFFSC